MFEIPRKPVENTEAKRNVFENLRRPVVRALLALSAAFIMNQDTEAKEKDREPAINDVKGFVQILKDAEAKKQTERAPEKTREQKVAEFKDGVEALKDISQNKIAKTEEKNTQKTPESTAKAPEQPKPETSGVNLEEKEQESITLEEYMQILLEAGNKMNEIAIKSDEAFSDAIDKANNAVEGQIKQQEIKTKTDKLQELSLKIMQELRLDNPDNEKISKLFAEFNELAKSIEGGSVAK